MHSVVAFAVLSAIAASAAPHGHNHFHLHPARSPRHLIAEVDNLITPIAGRSDIGLPLDLQDGTCGGSTGFGCGDGFCCSKWGYCGVTEDYCGAGCQFGSCNGSATGPAPAPSSNATEPAPAPAEYSSQGVAPIVTIQMTVTAASPSPIVTESTTSEAAPSSDQSISAAAAETGLASKDHGPPAYTQSWQLISAGWGQPSSAAAPTTFATQASAPVVTPTLTPSSSVAAPVYTTPPSSSAAAPAYTQTVSTSPSADVKSSSSPSSSGGAGLGNVYTLYQGDGTAPNWPSQDQWMSLDDMWTSNLALIAINCDNSDIENSQLKDSIQSVASSSGVPASFILAIVMQESKGCVRVTTTALGNGNPGLMQSHEGSGSCNNGAGVMQTPCPQSEIQQMIEDGTDGTSSGPGLVQLISQAGCDDVSKYYKAARMYNSGNNLQVTNIHNLNVVQYGTASYCSDVANRLMGWTTASSGFSS